MTRINNTLRSLPERLETAKNQLETLHTQVRDAEAELLLPFAQAGEMAEKEARLAYLNAALNIDGNSGELDAAADAPEMGLHTPRPAASAKSEKPSILDGLRSHSTDSHTASTPNRDRPPDHGTL